MTRSSHSKSTNQTKRCSWNNVGISLLTKATRHDDHNQFRTFWIVSLLSKRVLISYSCIISECIQKLVTKFFFVWQRCSFHNYYRMRWIFLSNISYQYSFWEKENDLKCFELVMVVILPSFCQNRIGRLFEEHFFIGLVDWEWILLVILSHYIMLSMQFKRRTDWAQMQASRISHIFSSLLSFHWWGTEVILRSGWYPQWSQNIYIEIDKKFCNLIGHPSRLHVNVSIGIY